MLYLNPQGRLLLYNQIRSCGNVTELAPDDGDMNAASKQQYGWIVGV
jgi:hypothetical protein